MKLPACLDRTRAGAICVLICAAYTVAGLYPFDFIAENDVRWLSPGPGISLSGHALIRSTERLDLSADGFTLEFYLEPADEPARELGTLMSLYDGRLPQNLVVAQWRGSFLVRTAVQDARGRRRYREAGIAALPKGVRRFIAVTAGPGGMRFYSDGAPVRTYPKMTVGHESLSGDLILGTGTHSGNAWKGKLFGLALFDEPLKSTQIEEHRALWARNRGAELASDRSIVGLYLFEAGRGRTVCDSSPRGRGLVIPEVYRAPAKEVLGWNDWDNIFSQKRDLLLNIVGFIPFGFFYFLYRALARPGRRLATALHSVALSGAISLIIELLQIFLPSRSSSLVDFLCNTAGGAAGVLAAYWLHYQTCGYPAQDRT